MGSSGWWPAWRARARSVPSRTPVWPDDGRAEPIGPAPTWSSTLPEPTGRAEPIGPATTPLVGVETDVGPLLFQAHPRLMVPMIAEHGRWEVEESDQLRALGHLVHDRAGAPPAPR